MCEIRWNTHCSQNISIGMHNVIENTYQDRQAQLQTSSSSGGASRRQIRVVGTRSISSRWILPRVGAKVGNSESLDVVDEQLLE